MSASTHLAISWSVSKGRDTYGYNICRLDDVRTGKRYRCNGGGYDMIGTVFGDWLEDTHQAELTKIETSKFYGCRVNDGRISLDGACGISSMQAIAEACGLEVKWLGNRKGHTTGFLVTQP